jgi:hypothetical protein
MMGVHGNYLSTRIILPSIHRVISQGLGETMLRNVMVYMTQQNISEEIKKLKNRAGIEFLRSGARTLNIKVADADFSI